MSSKLRFLIAYGPTEEPLDPVRYLSNRSTGVLGKYLVASAKKRGHKVTPVECPKTARTALDLLHFLQEKLKEHDVLMMVAAVCDVRPAAVLSQKIKKDALKSLKLIKNPDVLAELAKQKTGKQVFIGFGLESDKVMERGRQKLHSKSLEAIVLQKVTENELPFGDKKVKCVILSKKGPVEYFSAIEKSELAEILIRKAEVLSSEKTPKKAN